MEARAKARQIRVSPRKARIVVDLVRGKSVEKALEILKFSKQAVARPIEKTVASAMSNLAGKFEHPVEPSEMSVKEIFVDEGQDHVSHKAEGPGPRVQDTQTQLHDIGDG